MECKTRLYPNPNCYVHNIHTVPGILYGFSFNNRGKGTGKEASFTNAISYKDGAKVMTDSKKGVHAVPT